MFQEITGLTDGNSRRINLGHRAQAHYVNSFLEEVLRHCPEGTIPPTHRTMEDVVIEGMRIPKDTQVGCYLCSLLLEKEYLKS